MGEKNGDKMKAKKGEKKRQEKTKRKWKQKNRKKKKGVGGYPYQAFKKITSVDHFRKVLFCRNVLNIHFLFESLIIITFDGGMTFVSRSVCVWGRSSRSQSVQWKHPILSKHPISSLICRSVHVVMTMATTTIQTRLVHTLLDVPGAVAMVTCFVFLFCFLPCRLLLWGPAPPRSAVPGVWEENR